MHLVLRIITVSVDVILFEISNVLQGLIIKKDKIVP